MADLLFLVTLGPNYSDTVPLKPLESSTTKLKKAGSNSIY